MSVGEFRELVIARYECGVWTFNELEEHLTWFANFVAKKQRERHLLSQDGLGVVTCRRP